MTPRLLELAIADMRDGRAVICTIEYNYIGLNSQGKPDKANLVNSTRVISGNGALKIGTM